MRTHVTVAHGFGVSMHEQTVLTKLAASAVNKDSRAGTVATGTELVVAALFWLTL
jgi:ribosomal protein L7Ae-like RNA K-turn-binding protein